MTAAPIGPTKRRHPSTVIVGGAFAFSTLLGTLGLSAATPVAMAAPNNANTFVLNLECSNGQEHAVTVLEPAPDRAAVHVVDSRSVLVPTVFQWHVVVTDAHGNILDESTPPPELVHGRSGEQLKTIECTFSQTAHHDSPEGGYTVRVEGTVQALDPGSKAGGVGWPPARAPERMRASPIGR